MDLFALNNGLCFPLYVCAKEVVRKYKPFLDEIDLTYTRYIAMTALWERGAMTVNELGEILYLDSGTLTPLLKRLETAGLVTRLRAKEDERSVVVSLTERGSALKASAADIPEKVGRCVSLEPDEAAELNRLLKKLIGKL